MSKRRRRARDGGLTHARFGRRRFAVGAGLGLGAALGMGATANADEEVFTVTTTADSGTGSLRDVMGPANAADGDPIMDVDEIVFSSSVTGTINLASALPHIEEPLTISGPGARILTINGGASQRAFYVNTPGSEPVIVEALTLTGNRPTPGGAVFHVDADLTLREVAVTGSTTTGDTSQGGGIYSFSGDLLIERSTVSGNSTSGAGAEGGGIYTFSSSAVIRLSTISGNSTSGMSAQGGGISARSGNLTIESSTIAANSTGGASAPGGGAHLANNVPEPALTNTIVADNSASALPDLSTFGDTPQLAFSLVEDLSTTPVSSTVPGSNVLGIDPLLETLDANGGSTDTHAFPPTSPAADKGMATGTDQRGTARPFNLAAVLNGVAAGANGADIGAFELNFQPKCAGRPETVRGNRGTPKADVIVGTGRSETIRAKGGKDLVCARGGKDRVLGSTGRDRLFGEAGRDKLKGQEGDDKLFGGPAGDLLIGGPGTDLLNGGGGKDVLRQ